MHHQHVPLFGWPEETGDLAVRAQVDAGLAEAVLAQHPVDQLAKTIHLLAAGDGRPATAVRAGLLFVRLRFERAPVMGDGFAESVLKGWQNDGHPVANHGS